MQQSGPNMLLQDSSSCIHIHCCIYCRAKYKGVPLLGSNMLNVSVPTIPDLADSLPTAWRKDICDYSGAGGKSHPNRGWLEDFWSLAARTMNGVPAELQSFALVPITGNCLASVDHCINSSALSHKHLYSLPSTAAATLSTIGCLCIGEERADTASAVPNGSEPLTSALQSTSNRLGVPLQQLVSLQRLGSSTFAQARQLLAYHVCKPTRISVAASVWQILRQLPIFEDDSGGTASLLPTGQIQLLPNANWEGYMTELNQLLQWKPLKYHTASATQQQLLKHSDLQAPTLPDFLRYSLLPAINSSTYRREGLLLQALDELAAYPTQSLSTLTKIYVSGRLHSIKQVVDSTSALCKSLFSQGSSDFTLLPEAYATPQRLAVLKRHGLAHEGMSDASFFLTCAERFSALRSSMSRDDSKRVSRGLVNMLHANLSAYQGAHNSMGVSDQVSTCPIFKSAELQLPYISTHPTYVSLAGSADHDHYRLVALAVPVIDNAHGDTKELRAQLGLSREPKLERVVDHMLKMAAAGHLQALSRQTSHPFSEILLEDIEHAYEFIVNGIKQKLAAAYQTDPELHRVTKLLAEEPWVLVQVFLTSRAT